MKMKKHLVNTLLYGCLSTFLAALSCLAQTAQAQEKPSDILIVYSSGSKPAGGGQPDAVTTPTPADENMKTVTEKLSTALAARKLTVRVALAHEIKTPEEIFASRVLVIGSPSYFWNVSWQIKKFFDERFSEMSSRKDRLGKHKVAAYTQAGGKDGADLTIAAIQQAVNRWNGTFGPTMIILVPHGPEEIAKRIAAFADSVVALVK